jgi:pimeloyl-ACP methyl ester carboxylesterase
MTVVLVHGFPETAAVWRPLQDALDRETVAVALPGFGTGRPAGFTGTKDALAEWLAEKLARFERPVDVVGHDAGALLTMRVATVFDVPLRSWAVDVPDIFHPDHVWPERLRTMEQPDAVDPERISARLVAGGVPRDLAGEIATTYDERMSRSIFDFYRSAMPNVAADWWHDAGPTRSRGLVLLLPDPPEIEEMSVAVAERLGAETARLDELNHCWMAEAPDRVAPVLERFWSSLE